MYCHGASELEHNRFTQFNLSALSKREKSFMSKPPAVFFLDKGNLFYFGGFVIPNKVARDLFLTSGQRMYNAACITFPQRISSLKSLAFPFNDRFSISMFLV